MTRCGPIVVSMLALSISASAAEPLDGALTVNGREVEVLVRHKDGRPAAGIGVRLLYGRQLTAASARTDAAGRWSHTVAQTGAYEIVVDSGAGPEDDLRLPFTARDEATVKRFSWRVAGPGLACLAAAALLFAAGKRTAPRLVRCASLVALLAGAGLLGWSAWSHWREPAAVAAPPSADVAGAAREFLRSQQVKPLSGSLERLLADPAAKPVKSDPHPLLGHAAPDFELTDHLGQPWRLKDRLARGPVVLVFYFGYHCNHCVGQLFAVHDDIDRFRELGAEVVAVSADPPESTRDRFGQFGAFAFPVLSDPGNRAARAWGVYRPAARGEPDELLHGTFVIGRDGRVHWAQTGSAPFTGNLTLLREIARLEDRLPAAKRE